jgi:tetratricopeptide (TPR) repeat protein
MSKQETSVQVFESKFSQNPESLVFSRLADGYRKNGEIQQAISVCSQGLAIHPDYVTGRVILGRCYLEQEKLKEAIEEFVKVVGLDRRNQVALKMIADIYARQGLKEKAGDLYATLLDMDPDNQSLVKLSSTFRGTGQANVLATLGISTETPQTAAVRADAPAASDEVIVDADKTIQMELGPRRPAAPAGEEGELGEMLVKTQQFDARELGAAAGASEERAGAVGVVTGDDVSSRMTAMFEGEQAASGAAEPEVLDHVDIGSDKALESDEEIGAATVKGAGTDIVSGSDISSRIEQLFGSEEPPAAATDSNITRVADSRGSVQAPPTREISGSELRPVENSAISGEDIASRLNEMFEDAPAMEPLAADLPPEEPAAVGASADEAGPFLDIAADIGAKSMSGANEEIVVEDARAAVPPEKEGVISGDDVALRLDTIFEEGEKTELPGADSLSEAVATQSSEATDVATAEEGTARAGDVQHQEEDTKPPFDIGESGIVIGDDESSSETLVTAGTGVSASADATPPEPAIDDAVEPEEDNAPGMSGDDVVGRMNELFSDSLIKDDALKSAESIPEGDKEDQVVNQGFYTMSGENAETSESEDILLSELDKIDVAAPESDTLDLAREPEEKTVLMDEDAGEEAMPAGSKDPFLSEPSAPIDKAESDDTVRTDRLRPVVAEEESAADADLERTEAYSIPDHVLTPTLADIYYQQGQPRLALQIYRRLLEADPDNERMANRIREIETSIASQETEETVAMDAAPRTNGAASLREKPQGEYKKREASGAKPLSGVRIKKKFKNRIRKTR